MQELNTTEVNQVSGGNSPYYWFLALLGPVGIAAAAVITQSSEPEPVGRCGVGLVDPLA